MWVGLLRAVGVGTAVYGAAVAARPGMMARPSGLVDEEGRTEEHTAVALRPLGWRDAASGVAMALAPSGPVMVAATGMRVAADVGDAVLLGQTLPDPRRRRLAVAVALGWGALSVAGLVLPARCGREQEQERGRGRMSDPATMF